MAVNLKCCNRFSSLFYFTTGGSKDGVLPAFKCMKFFSWRLLSVQRLREHDQSVLKRYEFFFWTKSIENTA